MLLIKSRILKIKKRLHGIVKNRAAQRDPLTKKKIKRLKKYRSLLAVISEQISIRYIWEKDQFTDEIKRTVFISSLVWYIQPMISQYWMTDRRSFAFVKWLEKIMR